MVKIETHGNELEGLQTGILSRLSKIKEQAQSATCPPELLEDIKKTEEALHFTSQHIKKVEKELCYGAEVLVSFSEHFREMSRDNIRMMEQALESRLGGLYDIKYIERDLALNASSWATRTAKQQGLAIKMLREREDACIEMLQRIYKMFEGEPDTQDEGNRLGHRSLISNLKTLNLAGKNLEECSDSTPEELESVANRLRELIPYDGLSEAPSRSSVSSNGEGDEGSCENHSTHLLITKGIHPGAGEGSRGNEVVSPGPAAFENIDSDGQPKERHNGSQLPVGLSGEVRSEEREKLVGSSSSLSTSETKRKNAGETDATSGNTLENQYVHSEREIRSSEHAISGEYFTDVNCSHDAPEELSKGATTGPVDNDMVRAQSCSQGLLASESVDSYSNTTPAPIETPDFKDKSEELQTVVKNSEVDSSTKASVDTPLESDLDNSNEELLATAKDNEVKMLYGEVDINTDKELSSSSDGIKLQTGDGSSMESACPKNADANTDEESSLGGNNGELLQPNDSDVSTSGPSGGTNIEASNEFVSSNSDVTPMINRERIKEVDSSSILSAANRDNLQHTGTCVPYPCHSPVEKGLSRDEPLDATREHGILTRINLGIKPSNYGECVEGNEKLSTSYHDEKSAESDPEKCVLLKANTGNEPRYDYSPIYISSNFEEGEGEPHKKNVEVLGKHIGGSYEKSTFLKANMDSKSEPTLEVGIKPTTTEADVNDEASEAIGSNKHQEIVCAEAGVASKPSRVEELKDDAKLSGQLDTDTNSSHETRSITLSEYSPGDSAHRYDGAISESKGVKAQLQEGYTSQYKGDSVVESDNTQDELPYKRATSHDDYLQDSECSGNLRQASLNSEKNTKLDRDPRQAEDLTPGKTTRRASSSQKSVYYEPSVRDNTGNEVGDTQALNVDITDDHNYAVPSENSSQLDKHEESLSTSKAESSRDFHSARSNRATMACDEYSNKEKQSEEGVYDTVAKDNSGLSVTNRSEKADSAKSDTKSNQHFNSLLKRLTDIDLYNEYPGIFMSFENSKMPSLEPPEVLELLNIYRAQVAAAVLERDKLSDLAINLEKRIKTLESVNHALRAENTSEQPNYDSQPREPNNTENLEANKVSGSNDIANVGSLEHTNASAQSDKISNLSQKDLKDTGSSSYKDEQKSCINAVEGNLTPSSNSKVINQRLDSMTFDGDKISVADTSDDDKPLYKYAYPPEKAEKSDTGSKDRFQPPRNTGYYLNWLLFKVKSHLKAKDVDTSGISSLNPESVVESLLMKSRSTNDYFDQDMSSAVLPVDNELFLKNKGEFEKFFKLLADFYSQLERKITERDDIVRTKDEEIQFLKKAAAPGTENLFAHTKALEIQVESLLKQLVNTEFELSRSRTEIKETREALEILEGCLLIEREKNNHISSKLSNQYSSKVEPILGNINRYNKTLNMSSATMRFDDEEASNYKHMIDFAKNPKKYKLNPSPDSDSLISAVNVRTNLPKSIIKQELRLEKRNKKRKEIHSGLRKQSLGWREYMNKEYNRASVSKKLDNYFNTTISASPDKSTSVDHTSLHYQRTSPSKINTDTSHNYTTS